MPIFRDLLILADSAAELCEERDRRGNAATLDRRSLLGRALPRQLPVGSPLPAFLLALRAAVRARLLPVPRVSLRDRRLGNDSLSRAALPPRSPREALLGGVVFALGGFLTSLVPLTNQLDVAAWLPWALLAGEDSPLRGRWRRFFQLTILVSLQALGGAPEALLLTRCCSVRRSSRPRATRGLDPAARTLRRSRWLSFSAPSQLTIPDRRIRGRDRSFRRASTSRRSPPNRSRYARSSNSCFPTCSTRAAPASCPKAACRSSGASTSGSCLSLSRRPHSFGLSGSGPSFWASPPSLLRSSPRSSRLCTTCPAESSALFGFPENSSCCVTLRWRLIAARARETVSTARRRRCGHCPPRLGIGASRTGAIAVPRVGCARILLRGSGFRPPSRARQLG